MNEHHLNLTYIKKLSAGNNLFIVRMLQTFCNNIPPGISDLVKHAHEGNLAQAKQVAHKLKTMFRYVGMETVGEDLEQLEFGADDMSPAERNNLLKRVELSAHHAVNEAQDIILATPV